jgi:type II secretory pathway component PulC
VIDGVKTVGFAVNKIWSTKSVLKKGDVILQLNGQSWQDGVELFSSFGESEKLKIWRAGKIIEIDAALFFAGEADYNKIY